MFEDIMIGFGKSVNDATRFIMGIPNNGMQSNNTIKATLGCPGCGQPALQTQPNNGSYNTNTNAPVNVQFNADKGKTVLTQRQNEQPRRPQGSNIVNGIRFN